MISTDMWIPVDRSIYMKVDDFHIDLSDFRVGITDWYVDATLTFMSRLADITN